MSATPASAGAQGAGPHIAEVHALIDRVEQLSRFTPEAVARLVGVSLLPAHGSLDRSAEFKGGTFSRVTFREFRPQGGEPSWQISVTVRRENKIPITAIDRRFIGRRLHAATKGPYESVATYVLDLPGVLLRLRYGAESRNLQDLIFQREGTPDRTLYEARLVQVKSRAQEIAAMVGTAKHLPRFSRQELERLFNVSLVPSRSAPPQSQSWEADILRGPFSRVQYLERRSPSGPPEWTFTLLPRRDPPIALRFLERAWIGDEVTRLEREGNEPTRLFVLKGPNNRFLLGFGVWSEHLHMLTFSRFGVADMPASPLPP